MGMAPAEKLFGKSYLKDIDDVTKAMGHVGADIRCLIVPWELDGRTPEEAGRPDDAGLVDRGGGDGDRKREVRRGGVPRASRRHQKR